MTRIWGSNQHAPPRNLMEHMPPNYRDAGGDEGGLNLLVTGQNVADAVARVFCLPAGPLRGGMAVDAAHRRQGLEGGGWSVSSPRGTQ